VAIASHFSKWILQLDGVKTRHIARQFRATPAAVDDLVELTLRTAVDEKASQPSDMPLNLWLRRVMRRVVLH
jgi:hypothetical protein